MKKIIYLALAIVLVLSVFAGCKTTPAQEPDPGTATTTEQPAAPADDNQPEALKKIGLVVCHMTDEWAVGSYTMMQQDGVSMGYDITFADSEWELPKEAQSLDTFLPMGLDMLVIQPVDEAATGAVIQPFLDTGIPVLSVGIKAENDGIIGFVGWDVYDSGYQLGLDCANYIENSLGGTANVLMLSYPVENTLQRQRGFEAALEDSGVDVTYVADQNFEGSRETAVQIIENTIQAGTDFDVVWAAFDAGALGARAALEAVNHKAKIWSCGGYGEEIYNLFESDDQWFVADYVVAPYIYVDSIWEAMGRYFNGESNVGDVYAPFPIATSKNYRQVWGEE